MIFAIPSKKEMGSLRENPVSRPAQAVARLNAGRARLLGRARFL
ncbi:MAG: hypothetical protein ACRYFU_25565 [Janthinobacterium lividum]